MTEDPNGTPSPRWRCAGAKPGSKVGQFSNILTVKEEHLLRCCGRVGHWDGPALSSWGRECKVAGPALYIPYPNFILETSLAKDSINKISNL